MNKEETITKIFDLATKLWYMVVYPTIKCCPRGHPGVSGPSSDASEYWSQSLGEIRGVIQVLQEIEEIEKLGRKDKIL